MRHDDSDRESVEFAAPRRVVTGHDESGRSTVIHDGPAPHVMAPPGLPTLRTSVLWTTDPHAHDTAGKEETAPADLEAKLVPAPGGTLMMVVDFPPEREWEGVDVASILRHANPDGDSQSDVPADSAERHPFFHKTPTIDYAFVLDGEIWLLVDEGEVQLKQGDVLVQRGTSHAWANRGDRPARVAFVLINAGNEAERPSGS